MTPEAILEAVSESSAELVADWFRTFFAPPPILTVTEWAEKNRHLGSSEGAEPGPYRVSRTPYAQAPQDCMSSRSLVEEVVLIWAAQTGKTTLMLNCVGASIGADPGPIMIVWPTNTVAKKNSRQRIAPLLNESRQLASKIAKNRSRDKANTTLLKEFDGGILVIAGANSAADLRSTPVRDLYLDEVDNFPHDVDGEGDPSKLAEMRQTTFARKKRLRSSTPGTKGMSRIEDAFLASDMCRYQVPCPHCGAYQVLEFGAALAHGLKWDKDEDGAPIPTSVRYVCSANGCQIREHQKSAMLAGGVWVAEKPGAQAGKVRGFHLSGLYSPPGWLSWRTIALEWYEAMKAAARGDITLLRVFVNTRLAETFEESGDKADANQLRKRAQDIPLGVVQWGLLVTTLGVDTQGDRIEVYAWAWGRGMQRQLVDRRIFYGDPNVPEGQTGSVWAQLTAYRRAPLEHASGQTSPILAAFVDSGGHSTQAVYNYCRAHQHEHMYAVKGASIKKKPILGKPADIDVTWQGVKVKKGVKLWPIGTDTAKFEIYARLRVTAPGPGFVLMSKRLQSEIFDQLTSEKLVTRYVKGRAILEWIKQPGARNEALDCAVYALAAAMYVGIDRWESVEWDTWTRRVQPELAAAVPVAPVARPPAAPKQSWKDGRQW